MTAEKLQQRSSRQLKEFIESSSMKNLLEIAVQVDDAVYTIVHIKQQHYSDLYTKRVKDQLQQAVDRTKVMELKAKYFQQISKINKVQNEIYNFLVSSTSSKDFLFVEGRSYPHHYRDTFLLKFIPGSIAEANKLLNTKGSFGQPLPDPPYFLGSSIFLHREKKMTVLGAENLALLNLTLSLYESKKLSPSDLAAFIQECHQAREDQMIKNVTVDFTDLNYRMSSLRFLLCGSKHDFRENVEKWNTNNPDKKVNLLVFTPLALM